MTTSTTPQFADVHVQLTGQDGNVFAIIGRVRRALLKAGATEQQIDRFMEEMTAAGSCDAALAVVLRWVQVS